ncbi:MAG: N-acetyl-gamma-glutamyl-phosphate reductase [Deltaproteobacteria bacterium]
MKRTKVAVFGATGYTGFELIRLLLSHERAELAVLSSEQYSELPVDRAFSPFRGSLGGVRFGKMEEMLDGEFEAAFLALPHTVSQTVAETLLARGVRVIDLSADFRFRDPALYEAVYRVKHLHPALCGEAVYGLPEAYREELRTARLAAVPGCFPTAVILALLPLLQEGLIEETGIVADCKTGVSGGGRSPAPGFHYPEVEGGVRPYGLPRHRHNAEMDQELSRAAGNPVAVTFVPHLLPMVRGILATCYAVPTPAGTPEAIARALGDRYGEEPFVRVCPPGSFPSTKEVRGSNRCDVAVSLDSTGGRVVAIAAIDNLVKGASGAAVQCFNLMMGHPEEDGLRQATLYP